MDKEYFKQLAIKIKQIGLELGFNKIGITDTKLDQEIHHFKNWVKANNHGEMDYFDRHFEAYQNIENLMPNTKTIICCAVRYPASKNRSQHIAAFAQLTDYSKQLRKLLKKFSTKISEECTSLGKTRVFAGNAPILEKALATKAGIGWYGKNSILVDKNLGSYFFLGEILTTLPLPIDLPIKNCCKDCFKCKTMCPTNAIISPHKIDAKKCISYLTIEHKGSIPIELRPLIGTKIFGCDICQQACPWNKRNNLTTPNIFSLPSLNSSIFKTNDLINWFLWTEEEFKEKTAGTPIKRIGYERWLRNIAVALGNSKKTNEIIKTLQTNLTHQSDLVKEHIIWSLKKLNT